MANRFAALPLHALIQQLTEQLTVLVRAEVERRVLSVEEQRSMLARNRRLVVEGKLAAAAGSLSAAQDGPRIVRLPPQVRRVPRSLDMTCRVVGCPNRSRGPRAGFICDTHRVELTPEEQLQARDQWNSRKKAAAVAESAPLDAAPVPVLRQAVPPKVRKPEPVAQTESVAHPD